MKKKNKKKEKTRTIAKTKFSLSSSFWNQTKIWTKNAEKGQFIYQKKTNFNQLSVYLAVARKLDI